MLYRIMAGLKQKDAAKSLGVSPVSVWQWEHGHAMPRADRLTAIAELYGCTVEQLLNEEETA